MKHVDVEVTCFMRKAFRFQSSDNVGGVVAPVIGMPTETQPQARCGTTFLYYSQKRRMPPQFFNVRRHVFERPRVRMCLCLRVSLLKVMPHPIVFFLNNFFL